MWGESGSLAFLVVNSIDEAIDARRRNRIPRSLLEGPRGPGSLMGSEAGTSYTGGSSYVVPADEPPRLSMQDAPDDEVCFESPPCFSASLKTKGRELIFCLS